jgi:hypothetical protein
MCGRWFSVGSERFVDMIERARRHRGDGASEDLPMLLPYQDVFGGVPLAIGEENRLVR